MSAHLDGVIDSVLEREPAQEAALRDLDITITEADEAFFREAIAQWEATWSERASALETLRQAAAALEAE